MGASLGVAIAYMDDEDWEIIEDQLREGGANFQLFTIIEMGLEAGPYIAWVVCPNREEEDKVMEICSQVNGG